MNAVQKATRKLNALTMYCLQDSTEEQRDELWQAFQDLSKRLNQYGAGDKPRCYERRIK